MLGRSKYGAKKSIVDGIKFDSKEEAKRYSYLKSLEGTQVFNLELQPKFVLLPSFKIDGKTIRGMVFTADFQYRNISGETVVEDLKGFVTVDYTMRKKLFLWNYCREGKYKFFEIKTAGSVETFY
jgi:hypothetical protein